jgi:Trk K+ transport system NAD-binding subunit
VVDGLARAGLLPLLTGRKERDSDSREPTHTRLRGHVIVVGMNSLGRRLVEILVESGERVLAIDTDLEKLRGLPSATFLGNADTLAVLEEAGVREAKLVISALQIEDVNRLLAYRAARFGIPAVIHAQDQAAELEMADLDVAHFMDSHEAGVARMVEELRREGVFSK